ncbi:MAG: hypothetical protein JNL58_13010 [Planctomyces sp.]|nr:hypothetical protein [Planctomyces sp.]
MCLLPLIRLFVVVRVLVMILLMSPVAIVASSSMADAQEPPDTNYDEDAVPPYHLPNPLICFDGREITTPEQWWSTRRPEILEAFAENLYGQTPRIQTTLRAERRVADFELEDGTGFCRQVRIHLFDQAGTSIDQAAAPWIDVLMFIPAVAAPDSGTDVPVFLGLNYGNQGVSADPRILPSRNSHCSAGEHAHRWPVASILRRGYAVACFHGGDIELDPHGSGCRFTPDGWSGGIRSYVMKSENRAELLPNEWGSIGAWAWGLSRVQDYLMTDPEIDDARTIVFGHSRTGKTALWAAAQDPRFAMAISNNSGQGGASLARRRFGETVAASFSLSGFWYCRNYERFGNNEANLPVDSHELIGLIAPRPVYVASAEEDLWADPRGEFLAAYHAGPVYELLGKSALGSIETPPTNSSVGVSVGYHVRTGDHEITEYDWSRYLDFADRHLRRRRVLYNFDGDSCLSTRAGSKGPVDVNEDDVRRLIEEVAYKGSRVDTIFVCINAQAMYYPTMVGTMRGTLSTDAERESWPASEKQRFKNMDSFFRRGVDPYAIMLAESKRKGREALLTFRMNDDHGNDFLRTQFQADHPEWKLGTNPERLDGAMDFTHDEVRDYTYQLIKEAVQRYDCDGIELDFNRFPGFFRELNTEERVVRMNALVERIRKLLDELGDRRNRRYALSVRVPSNFGQAPPTPETARLIGCDVAGWTKAGWVDFVSVSEFLFERGDLPIHAWKSAITTVPVYGGIECTRGSGAGNLSAAEYRAAAGALMSQGSDGVYLFNFFTSREEGQNAYEPPFEVLSDLGVHSE